MNMKEIAELMEQDRKMINWAYRASEVSSLSQLKEEDREIAEGVDVWSKAIGRGEGNLKDMATFIRTIIEPEVYNAPDEILDAMFNRGSIGEFDNYGVIEDPVNRLNAIESGKYGNVDRSYIDYKSTLPQWKHLQIDTEIDMDKLRKGGYKTVADYIIMAEEAFRNKMFAIVFDTVVSGITSGDGYIDSANKITQTTMDTASNYLLDRGTSPILVGLSNIIRPTYSLLKDFLTDEMKKDINKYGGLKSYNGVTLVPVNTTYKMADGKKLLPEKMAIGIADKIGQLDMRGELRVLITEDNDNEKVHVKFTGFEFGYALNKLENVCKIVLS